MDEENAKILAIAVIVILGASTLYYLFYQNGAFSSYSSWVTSCTSYTDVISGTPFQKCSTPLSLPLQPQSVIAYGQTLYDTNPNSPTYGKSNPLTKDARITLSVGNANPSSITGTFICSALVDGKVAASSTNTTTFSSVPNTVKVCAVSIDGKVLQTQYFSPTVSTHVVSMAFKGTANYIYQTGRIDGRVFSGSLGNMTITISPSPVTTTTTITTTTTTTTTTTSTSTAITSITVINDKIPISGGTGAVVTSSSSMVTGPTTSPTNTNPTDPNNYPNQATKIILSAPSNVQIDTTKDPNYAPLANIGITSVSACQIGSCSLVPGTNGQATTYSSVSKDDIGAAARGDAAILKMFGASKVSDLTPYSQKAYFGVGNG